MSTQRDKIIAARNKGFDNATAHIPEDVRKQIRAKYDTQAANREKNYKTVKAQLNGGQK